MNRKKKSRKLIVSIAVAIVVVAAVVGAVAMKKKGSARADGATVKVERGSIVEKALAVGSIVPRNEISVKAKVSGVVKRIYKEPGQKVTANEPLIEIRPDPTPLELAEARRNIDMEEIAFDNMERSLVRSRDLVGKGLVSDKEFEEAQKNYDQAKLQLERSHERLELIEKGHVSIAGKEIDAIVKAPINGFILEKNINIGDPVVPLTSYQEGTVLMTLADMDSLIFKGTVDEIDVGKLSIGMSVDVKIGAIPNATIPGKLAKISLKAKEENNTRMFPVEITISDTKLAVLRAGYSANADIIIRQVDSVLTIPERVVYTKGDSSWVEVSGAKGERKKVSIVTGLSDAIRVEVKSGLKERQEVLEKPEKKI
ncbi:MAG: efflux RND transporter periplasmic adaptor subunit [Candidatus Krumholzibacteria bacterium]|nr:efflux RND transporter periplasmic adaptor subunit [Candidatus Krumholzibacteria bacterium]